MKQVFQNHFYKIIIGGSILFSLTFLCVVAVSLHIFMPKKHIIATPVLSDITVPAVTTDSGVHEPTLTEDSKDSEETSSEEISVEKRFAVLTGDSPLFMYTSNTLTGDVSGMLLPGSCCEVTIDDGANWFLIQSGDFTGFVERDRFLLGKDATAYAEKHFQKKATVVSNMAYLYKEPSTDSAILGIFSKGENLTTKSEKDGFCSVKGVVSTVVQHDVSSDTEDVSYGVYENYRSNAKDQFETEVEEFQSGEKKVSVEMNGYLCEDALLIEPDYLTAVDPDLNVYSDYFSEECLSTYGADSQYDVAQQIVVLDSSDKDSYSNFCNAVIEFALQFVGNPYVWGGESLTEGCDCSGFVMKIYEHFGVKLPHGSAALRSCGYFVTDTLDESVMCPGDILCYDGHCAIYIGNGQKIEAKSKKDGIIVSDLYSRNDVICIRRVLVGHGIYGEVTDEEFDALCRIVESEAGTEGRQGKIYVADTILNRVASSKFPNTIIGVIKAPHQFQPVSNGRYYSITVTEETRRAVAYALSHSDSTQGALYFMNPKYADPKNAAWFYSSLTYLFTYKNAEFFR